MRYFYSSWRRFLIKTRHELWYNQCSDQGLIEFTEKLITEVDEKLAP